jgi:2-iminobutanoate/2-iminopropanoate deaminase
MALWSVSLRSPAGLRQGRAFRLALEHTMRRRTWLSAGLPVALSFAFALMFVLAPSRLHAQERRVFNPPGAPTNLPFSNGIQVGDMLWVAGTEGVVNGDIESETRTTLENVKKVLDAAGYTPGEVVQVTVYLADVNDFDKMNSVYKTFFPDPKPTRATVQVAHLVHDAKIEIAAVAVHSHKGSSK